MVGRRVTPPNEPKRGCLSRGLSEVKERTMEIPAEEETASTKASGQKRAGLLKGKQGSADVADRQKSRMVGARHTGLRKGFQF